MKIIQSTNVKDYQPIFEGLIDDFGYVYYYAILSWCKIIDTDEVDPRYWQVYLIKHRKKIVGICGLYSLRENSIDELWLGWFGILPDYRSHGIGGKALEWMIKSSKKMGTKKLLSYVDEDGKPLEFYYRHGFKLIGNVKGYVKSNPEFSIDEFESPKDHVIELIL